MTSIPIIELMTDLKMKMMPLLDTLTLFGGNLVSPLFSEILAKMSINALSMIENLYLIENPYHHLDLILADFHFKIGYFKGQPERAVSVCKFTQGQKSNLSLHYVDYANVAQNDL